MDESTHPVAATRPTVTTPLKLALKRAQVSQSWLAEEAGIDPAQISDYVRGQHVPRAFTRQTIVEALRRHPNLANADVTEEELWPREAFA